MDRSGVPENPGAFPLAASSDYLRITRMSETTKTDARISTALYRHQTTGRSSATKPHRNRGAARRSEISIRTSAPGCACQRADGRGAGHPKYWGSNRTAER